jgi:ATP-dependent DNA ligase
MISFRLYLEISSATQLLDGSNWEYEVKYDGYRALGIKSGAT